MVLSEQFEEASRNFLACVINQSFLCNSDTHGYSRSVYCKRGLFTGKSYVGKQVISENLYMVFGL